MTWIWLTRAGMVLFTGAGLTLSAVQHRPLADLSEAHFGLRFGSESISLPFAGTGSFTRWI
jgi:hypothetical protein